MRSRIVVLMGVVMVMVSFMLLTPDFVNAQEVPAGAPADGFHNGIGNPSTGCLLFVGGPDPTQNVDIDDWDDIKVTIDLLLSVNNNYIGGTDYTQMDYVVDFYEVNSVVNIDHSVSNYLRVIGSTGGSGTPVQWTYYDLIVGDTMLIVIYLDLAVYRVPPGVGIASLSANPLTHTITAT